MKIQRVEQKAWGWPAANRGFPAAQLHETSVGCAQVPGPGLGHKGRYRFDDRQEAHGYSRRACTVPRQTAEAQGTGLVSNHRLTSHISASSHPKPGSSDRHATQGCWTVQEMPTDLEHSTCCLVQSKEQLCEHSWRM